MLKDLITISRFYGANKEYVIAGGGNTSFKNASHIWIKASGISLETIDEGGFVCLSREKLQIIGKKRYSTNAVLREQEVKTDLQGAVSGSELRPSVETSLHNLIDYAYVVHTHPTKLNALLCSKKAETVTKELFGKSALFVEYTDPGYILFKTLRKEIDLFKKAHDACPKLLFLENHGVFVAADTTDEVKDLYEKVMKKVEPATAVNVEFNAVKNGKLQQISILTALKGKSVLAFSGPLIRYFTRERKSFANVDTPFTPDQIVYCKSKYLYMESAEDLRLLSAEIRSFRERFGYLPRVIALADMGLITVGDDEKSAITVFDVYYDMMKISRLSEFYGGPKPMTPKQIAFIDTWEVENYRRKVAEK